MKKLHLFVIKSYLGPLFLTFFIALFILLMQFLWKYIEDIVGKGLEVITIVELLMYATAGLVPMALPLAILLASLMTFGNFGENYELTALKAAGISLQQIMKPLVVLTLFISIGAYYFANYILPYSNLQVGSLLYDISKKRPEMNIKTGIFNNTIENYSIKVMRKNPETKMMYDFMIYDHSRGPGSKRVTLADSGRIHVTADEKLMRITLYNGENYFDVKEKKTRRKDREYPMQRDMFSEQVITIKMEGNWNRTDQNLFKHHFQMMNSKQLLQSEDSLSKVFAKQKNDYSEALLRSNYLIRKRHRHSQLIIKDSVDAQTLQGAIATGDSSTYRKIYMIHKKDSFLINEIPYDSLKSVANLDTMFHKLSRYDKQTVLGDAQKNVRRIMKNLDSTHKQFRGRNERIRRHWVELHRKFTLSFACIIFFFIGAPLGAIIRKGGLGVPVVISVNFFIFYYVVSLFGEKMGREGILPVWQGMWIASTILLPIGAFFTYMSTTDASLFSLDSYKHAISKLVTRIKKSKKKGTETPIES